MSPARAIDRWILIAVVGFAPVVLMLATWAPDGRLTAMQLVLRSHALPVVAAELFVVAVALREGLGATLRGLAVPRPLAWAAALLAAIMVTTAIVAPDPAVARLRTLFWFVHALFGLSVMQLCGRHFSVRDLVHAYLAGFIMFTGLFAAFVLAVPDLAAFDWTRSLPGFGHIRHYGYHAAAAVGLAAGLMAAAERRGAWAAAFGVSTIGFCLAFWTGSRGAIAAAAAALVAAMLVAPGMRRLKAWAGMAASGALSVALVWWLPAPAANMGFARTVAATAGAQQHGITTGRTDLWQLAWGAIVERPWFGHGEGQMATVATFSTMVQPHNVLLQTLLAWGVAGTLCILALGAAFAIATIRAVRMAGPELAAPFMAMLTLAAYAGFDGTLYHVVPVSIFAACAGLVAAHPAFSLPALTLRRSGRAAAADHG